MTIQFMGGEIGAFVPSDSTVGEYGNASSTFERASMMAAGSSNYAESPQFSAITTCWTHMVLTTGPSGYSGLGGRFSWYDGSGVERIRLRADNSGSIDMQISVGAGWVTVGSAISIPLAGTWQTLDVGIVCNSVSGSVKLYVAGTLRIDSGTIDLSAITSIRQVRITGATVAVGGGSSAFAYISQVIVADEPTIGWRLLTRYANGGGATGDFTGDYTSIDETSYSDTDFVNSSTANQVELFTQTGAALTGYVPRAVAVTARARRGATGPQNIQLALRSSGTNYFSSTKALDVGYGAFCNVWETDPATTADWLTTNIDTLQFGVKSIA